MFCVDVDAWLCDAAETDTILASVASIDGGVSNMVEGVVSKVTAEGSDVS